MIIIIAGATACGKSDISFNLAAKLNTEIISADSMQVYRYFDIGTAKALPETRKKIKHHLIDIINPDENFNADNFSKVSSKIIKKLQKENKIPIITGGTGLYIKALIEGYSCGVKADKKIRKQISQDFQNKGNIFMYNKLKEVDSEYAKKIHSNDKLRISRALEVFYSSNKPFSSYLKQHKSIYGKILFFILERERKELYQRIEERMDIMFKDGLVEEAQSILKKGYNKEIKPLKSIGYRQVIRFLNKEIDFQECVKDAKKETRHYAKRQYTWFNGVKVKDTKKIKINNNDTIEDISKKLEDKILTY